MPALVRWIWQTNFASPSIERIGKGSVAATLARGAMRCRADKAGWSTRQRLGETRVKIVADAESLSRSDLGSITGKIWFVQEEYDFPEKGWSDFPVVVLSWWLEKAVAMKGGHSRSAEFSFMDGPFSVAVTLVTEKTLTLAGIRNDPKQQIFTSAEISLEALCAELIRAAQEIERVCGERSWESSDVLRLSQNVRSLKRRLEQDRVQH